VVAIVALAAAPVLAAACGGGGGSGASGVASSSATPSQNGALAFARCMRSHGVSGWPDPNSSGQFDKSKLRQLAVSRSRLTAISQTCSRLHPLDSSQAQAITPADQADYLRAAACMRSHGFPDFPDPTFPGNHVTLDIPPSIDQEAARFKRAAATCTRLIPAGLPYSSAGS
jgi:hypothetical protein